MDQKTPLQDLYNGLAAKNPQLKNRGFDAFKQDMQDENNLKRVFSGLASKNKALNDYGFDAFKNDMFSEIKPIKEDQLLNEYNSRPFTSEQLSFSKEQNPQFEIPNRKLGTNQFEIEQPRKEVQFKANTPEKNAEVISNNLPTIDQGKSFEEQLIDQREDLYNEIHKIGELGDENAKRWVKNIFKSKENKLPYLDYENDNELTATSKQVEPLWEEANKITHAIDLLKKADEYKNAPDKNSFSSLWKGIKSPLAKDLLSFGLQEMERNMQLAKSSKNGATGADKQLLEAYRVLKEVQNNPENEPSFTYQTGEVVSNMIPYVIQFVLTRGSGTTTKAFADEVLKTGMRKGIGKIAAKGLSYTAGAMGQAATMPMMYSKFGEEVAGGKNYGNAMLQSFLKTTGETFGENFGEVGQKLLTKTLAKNSKGIRSNLLKAIGWNGPWEYVEENVTNLWNTALTDEREWKDFWVWKEQGIIALSTSIIGAPLALQNKYAKNKVINQYRASEDKINNLNDELSRKIFEAVKDDNPEETLTNLYNIAESEQLSPETRKDVFTYAQDRLRYKAMFEQEGESKIYKPEQQTPEVNPQQQTDAIFEQYLKDTNQKADLFQHETGAFVAVTDNDGKQYFITKGDLNSKSGLLFAINEEGKEVQLATSNVKDYEVTPDRDAFINKHIQVFQEQKSQIDNNSVVIDGKRYLVLGEQIPGSMALQAVDEIGNPMDENIAQVPVEQFNAMVQGNDIEQSQSAETATVSDQYPLRPSNTSPQVGKEQPLSTEQTIQPQKTPIQQKLGKYTFDIIDRDSYDEVVPTDKMPFEKALPLLEKEFENRPKWEVVAEKAQVEIPGESKYDEPVKKVVIKSIRIQKKNKNQSNSKYDQNIDSQKEKAPKIENQATDVFQIGNNKYNYIQEDDGSYIIRFNEDQDPIEAEKEIRATLPEEQNRFEGIREEIEVTGEYPWNTPERKVVIRGIKVLPENTPKPEKTSEQQNEKLPEMVNNFENNFEKLTKTKISQPENEPVSIYGDEKSLQKNETDIRNDPKVNGLEEDTKTKYYGLNVEPESVSISSDEINTHEDVKPVAETYNLLKENWFANKDQENVIANIDTRNFQQQIKDSFDSSQNKEARSWKDTDRAIHVYLDGINEETISQYWDSLSEEQKRIVRIAQSLTPSQQAIADEIRAIYDKIGERALDQEIISSVLDNYVSRAWDLSNEKPSHETFTKFNTNTRHSKLRTLGSILEGWSKGYNLRIEGATNNLETLRIEINNVIENKRLLNIGLKTKTINGQPLFTTHRLDGYKEIEHPNFRKWIKWGNVQTEKKYRGDNFFISEDGSVFEKKKVYAPADIAKNLNNILGKSKLNEIPGIEWLTRLNARLKAIILSWSFFHHMAFTRSYIWGSALKGFKDANPVKAYKTGLDLLNAKDPEVIHLVRNGLTLGRNQEWDELLTEQKTKIGRWLDENKVAPGVREKIFNFHESHVHFLFNKYGAGLKVKSALLEYHHLLKKYPDFGPDELARKVARQTNADFGGLHLERMGRNKSMQHFLRLTLLAPDWTESNIITMVRVFDSATLNNAYRKVTKKEALTKEEKESLQIERRMYQ
ncbi:MAG: hypothetical protein JXP36_19040, partial [Bacteroidales bacterium]|nr:hypothetical protein [Bacteroidales bacterium]